MRLPRVVAAASTLALLAVLPACEPQCIDPEDCRAQAPAATTWECIEGLCVYEPEEEPGTGGGAAAGDAGAAGGGGATGGGSGGGATGGGSGGGGATGGGSGGGGATGGGTGGGGGTASGADGGRFFATLRAVEAIWPTDDGGVDYGDGGWKGTVSLNAVSMGSDLWQLRYTITHDAGAEITSAELRNAVGGTNGGLLETGTLASSGASPFTGMMNLSTASLNELKQGRAYVALPSAERPQGLIRGQVALATGATTSETVLTYIMDPVAGFPHPGSGGGASFLNMSTFVGRYEAQWTSDVVATAAHVHAPDGAVLVSMTLYPDAGGARGVFTLLALQVCQTQPCYNDVHTADAGASGSVLLRSR